MGKRIIANLRTHLLQFVGGYPNEYCIYLKDLTETEKSMIIDLDGKKINITDELAQMDD